MNSAKEDEPIVGEASGSKLAQNPETKIQKAAQEKPTTSSTTASQPIHDVFVQTNQSFRRTDRKRYEEMLEARKREEKHVRNSESTQAALAVQTFFHNLSLICQGFLAGIAVAHAVFAFVFADADTLDKGYEWIAMPVHATFYVGFVISTVSALDRFETGHSLLQTLKNLLNSQCACLSILLWTTGLAATLASTAYDGCLSAPSSKQCKVQFGDNPPVIWAWLSALRAGSALFGWFLLALSPNANFLRELIRKPVGLH